MRYTPSQAREIIGISQETLRYWRKVLPPLKEMSGKAAQFSAGDLLALLVIKEIVENLEVNITALSKISPKLFESCSGIRWHQLKGKFLIIDIKNDDIYSINKSERFPLSFGPSIYIDVEYNLDNLRQLLVTDDAIQFEINFGPTIIRRKNSGV